MGDKTISKGPTLCIRCECRKVRICWEVLSKELAVLDSRIERNFRAVVRLRVDLGSIDCVTFEREGGLRKNNTDRLVKLPQDGTVHWYHLGPNCLRVGRHASAGTANHSFVTRTRFVRAGIALLLPQPPLQSASC
jgi:hypothetical protein